MQKKIYYKGIYLNFFISYNYNILSGGHFGFLQTKHKWRFKTEKEDLKLVPREQLSEKEVLQRDIC